MSIQFLPYLSKDLIKLLENKKNYDFIINIDDNDNKKEFCLHSIILETRSSFFEDAISNGLAKKENNIYILNFPDISVDVFNIIIRYIYGGTIDLNNKPAADILNLLIDCEKFKLKELYDYVQDNLIKHHQSWIFQNFILIQQVSFKYSEFTKLQNYWTTIVHEEPEILFNAIDFTSVNKEVLLSIYKNENLCMEENELWDNIIRWGKAQNTELPEEINDWTTNDFNILKNSLQDFIPHIRFYEISSEDFCYKIMPYYSVLSNDLYQDLSKYHLVPNWQPKFNNLKPRKADFSVPINPKSIASNFLSFNSDIPSMIPDTPKIPKIPKFSIDSDLINHEEAALISSWIQGDEEIRISNDLEIYHEFHLLIRGSRDGFTNTVFHNMCDGKGPTIIILKLKNETSILGGYNPINWDINKHGNYEPTSESFLFNLGEEIILSRVQKWENAIFHSNRGISFRDLQLIDTFNLERGVYCTKNAYDKKIHTQGFYIADEYEVFSVISKS
ncbi:hypothetical protein C1645_871675, partial [Glomus cerebriforme]